MPEIKLGLFSDLVGIGMAGLQFPRRAKDKKELEERIEKFTNLLTSAIQATGRPNRGTGHSALWWTRECAEAHKKLVQRGGCISGLTEERREFKSIVRAAKKEYWRHIIDNAKEDRDLYRIIAWHKLEPKNQEPPLIIGQQTLTNTTAKAEALRKAILTRFSAEDDLPTTLANILNSRVTPATLLWDTHLTPEETEKSVVGVTSTSPGTDRLTVRLLKACWQHVRLFIHQIYQNCLELQHFPLNWKVAEVAMIPKAGKTDYSTPRAWRPIALLSCLGKGLERIIARRFSWTALKTQLLNPQHCSALPRRSATDLAASFTHDAELALSQGKQVTMVTMDIQGAFDALLVHRLLTRLLQQGWPDTAITIVYSFLTERRYRVRLGSTITPIRYTGCGTPQGSPLSPILYQLYTAELLKLGGKHMFGYADDINLYKASSSLDENVSLLAKNIREILSYGNENKIFFAPEKFELIHVTRKHGNYNPPIVVNEELTIYPTTSQGNKQAAVRWLGI